MASRTAESAYVIYCEVVSMEWWSLDSVHFTGKTVVSSRGGLRAIWSGVTSDPGLSARCISEGGKI